MDLWLPFPPGHFYSPLVNTDELRDEASRIWPEHPSAPGIDFQNASQEAFIRGPLRKYCADFNYPTELTPGSPEDHYYERNTEYGGCDGKALFAMLRSRPPQRMIEVGSGYSSMLTADVNVKHLGGSIDFTCIEPYPRQFLLDGVQGISNLVQKRVQDVPLETFLELQAGDILFIDSSHVIKTGSDATYLYLNILPMLRPGVLVHVHDIFLPRDYPVEWVIGESRNWNEQYIVQAILANNSRYRIVFGSASAEYFHPDILAEAVGTVGGGALWFEIQN